MTKNSGLTLLLTRTGIACVAGFAFVAGVAFAAAFAFAAGMAVAQAAPQQTASQTGREPQFENGAVRVWKSLVLPNAPLPLHRHEHPRVIIALRGGSMKILDETGKSEVHEWKTGNAYWLDANAAGTRHQDVNIGNDPIEVMVVELQNEK